MAGFLEQWKPPEPGSLGSPGPAWPGSGRVRPVVPSPASVAALDLDARAVAAPSAGARARGGVPPVERYPLASVGVRLGAFLLDLVTIQALLVVLHIAADVRLPSEAVTPAEQDAVARVLLADALFQLAYYTLWNALGWSPGKRVLGLRIVTLEGRRPGFALGFARTVGAILSGIVLFAGYLWALRDPRRQTWHDKIAGTFVVRPSG